MATICPSYLDTCKVMVSDIAYLPGGLANSSDVIDKFCKFVLQTFECSTEINQEFKATSGLLSTFGFANTISGFSKGDYRTTAKKISKGILLGAQGFDLFKGLDQLKLVSLGTVSSAIGRVPVLSTVISVSPPMAVAKDALIFVSTGFSLWDSWNESINIANQQGLRANVYQMKVHKNRIAVIADVAKLAIVGLMLYVAVSGVAFSTVVISTSYGALKLGTLANSIGFVTASSALIKSCHSAAAA